MANPSHIPECPDPERLHARGGVAGSPEGVGEFVDLEHPQIRVGADVCREALWNVWHMILDTRLGTDPQTGHNDPLFQIIAMRNYLRRVLKLEGDLL